MKKCPACKKTTMDFDEYFCRYRCFNPECGWIPPSSTEIELRNRQSFTQPSEVASFEIQELNLTLKATYASGSDVLMFDFGFDEPTFDLPESDGRMIWEIGHQTGFVTGFRIAGARLFGVSHVTVNIDARKDDIERSIRNFPSALHMGRANRVLIKRVEVMTLSDHKAVLQDERQIIDNVFRTAINTFNESYAHA